jgi:hypothetical protein
MQFEQKKENKGEHKQKKTGDICQTNKKGKNTYKIRVHK